MFRVTKVIGWLTGKKGLLLSYLRSKSAFLQPVSMKDTLQNYIRITKREKLSLLC